MVVDDEPLILEITQAMLEQLGYKVRSFEGAGEAVSAFSENPRSVDLIITDLSMPNMTGIEMARQLIEIRPDIPIIVCTGFSESMTTAKSQPLGVKAILTKPVLRVDLARAVRSLLDQN